MSTKKIQPIRFSRLAGYRENIYIYECLVLLYRLLFAGMEYNFLKYDLNKIDHLGAEYDTCSVMHYGAFAFSKVNKDLKQFVLIIEESVLFWDLIADCHFCSLKVLVSRNQPICFTCCLKKVFVQSNFFFPKFQNQQYKHFFKRAMNQIFVN